MTDKQDSVLFHQIKAKKGSIGHIQLNSPKSLNSLTLDMIQALFTQLNEWQNDEHIVLVVIEGAGERAFCAGGDVQKLYHSAISTPGGPCDYAEQFFCEEYQLNYLIHTYKKPIACIGHGFVMGGGLGLFAGASHRVVTQTSKIAMPEISIGLFPDVGGTYFLNRIPYGLGIFFALTGASINANDALHLGLADHYVSEIDVGHLLKQISQTAWQSDASKNHSRLTSLLNKLSSTHQELEQQVPSELIPHQSEIEAACKAGALGDIVAALNQVHHDSAWLANAIQKMNSGSQLSALLIFEQLRRYRYAELKQAFESELVLATNIVRFPEFAEGVRALLIEKDQNPNWKFAHFSHVPASLMEHFFTPPWDVNPLYEKLK